MSTVCQKCGDRGFVDALTYCIVCRASAEHCYCFDILPKVLNEDVIWVCEDCSSSVCESFSPVSSSHTPEVNDEKLCVKTQAVQSKPKRLLKRTQSLQAEKVCRTFVLLKSVPQDDEKGLPLKDPQPNSVAHAQPILDPICRGSMIIQNRNWTLNRLTAHLSNLACSKVSNETSLLPNLLTLEIFPRLVVWPKRFGSMASQDGDIALYFFPENESDEKAFDNLVDDMMLKELAVKTSIGNADLLIFTSLQLPLQHWRFQRKYYLWGLFIREKFSKSPTQDRVFHFQTP